MIHARNTANCTAESTYSQIQEKKKRKNKLKRSGRCV